MTAGDRAAANLEIVQEEFPNLLVPNGAKRDVAALREVIWSGELLKPLGSLRAGDRMRAHFAVFVDMRDGKIAAQRGFDPW